MAKRILDCYSSDFENFSKYDLLDAIAKSEGRTIACETIGTIRPMLGDITNAEYGPWGRSRNRSSMENVPGKAGHFGKRPPGLSDGSGYDPPDRKPGHGRIQGSH